MYRWERRWFEEIFEQLRRYFTELTAEEIEYVGEVKAAFYAYKEEKAKEQTKAKGEKGVREAFQGTLDPFAILPEEIWDAVLSLVSPVDKLAVCRTNSQLDLAFGESKNQWLFVQVLPLLMKHFSEKGHVLKCRQVCKDWRRAVNKFLESDHPSRRYYQKNHPVEQINCRLPTFYGSLRRCRLEHLQFTPKSIQKFSTYPNPSRALVGRAVSFQVSSLWGFPVIETFWAKAKSFLELHGKSIWHFKFVQYNRHLTTRRFYFILWDCLNLLPNLKTLEIHCQLNRTDVSIDRDISSYLQNSPLPVPPNLVSVVVEGLPQDLYKHVITRFGAQLKRFSLDMVDNHPESHLPRDLIELYVRRISTRGVLQQLCNIYPTPTECEKLTLDMSQCTWVQGPALSQTLSQFPVLTFLRILLQSRASNVFEIQRWLNMPTVEYFEIEGDGRDLFSFSTLLLAFPNLTYLHMRDTSNTGHDGTRRVREAPMPWTDAAKVEIERFLYSNKLEESPIWDTLQQLQVITYESTNGSFRVVSTREQAKLCREDKKKADMEFLTWMQATRVLDSGRCDPHLREVFEFWIEHENIPRLQPKPILLSDIDNIKN